MGYPEIFKRCVTVLLSKDIEGGYSNKSSDKGGETNFGISKRRYPDLNIKTLTRERAIEIYYNDYWIPMNIDRIDDDNLILQLFVFGVNAGPGTAIKILQRLVGVDDDGKIGSMTLRAVKEYNGNLVKEYIKQEKLFYVVLVQHDESQRINIKGWLRRIEFTHF